MRAQTVYVAEDGARFDDPAKADERDALIAEIDAIMAPLKPTPQDDHCHFTNGHGYVQQDLVTLAAVRAALLVPTKRVLKWWWDSQLEDHGKEPVNAHPSWFCRMLDGDAGPLDYAWGRFCRIDEQGREWGQQYYATHQDEAEQFEIKP